MNKQLFYNLVDNPHLLNGDTLKPLAEVIEQYPFFQTARMLMIKNLHNLEHIRFNNELKVCAAHIASRSALYQLVYKPRPVVVEDIVEDNVIGRQSVVDITESAEADVVVSIPAIGEDIAPPSADEPKISEVATVKDYFDVSDDLPDFFASTKAATPAAAPAGEVLPSADLLEYDLADMQPSYSIESELPAVDLSDDNSFSFSDWLNHMRHRKAEPEVSQDVSKEKNLIDNFLKQDTFRIVPKPAETVVKIEDKVKQSVAENEDLLSETLASIYIKQKHFQKAINIFEKLRLKYPEKNTYFASRISELEKMSNTQ